MASKVIVAGAPHGKFASLFTKLTTLHTKNSFACCLIIGDLFASPSEDSSAESSDVARLLSNQITVPLPTYFTLGSSPLPPAVAERISQNAGEVCPNLFFLGKRGVLTTSEGLRIVSLGGTLDTSLIGSSTATPADPSSLSPFYSPSDAAALRGANSADILITYDWPAEVQAGSEIPLPETLGGKIGSENIVELTKALRPRYHLAPGGEGFWEREPYRNELRQNEGADAKRATRFIALADYENPGKAKALYAFTIDPTAATTIPPNTTASPFPQASSNSRKRPAAGGDQNSAAGTFFWGDQTSGGGGRERPHKKRHHQKRPPPGPDQCFFCLSNPNLEKHLITSIGSDAYLTTAKGPLTSVNTNPASLSFSSHILIIPFAHTPTLSAIEPEEDRGSTMKEMKRYKSAIEKMLAKRGAGAVTFEIKKRDGVHAHWQVIPVSREKIAGVESAFEKANPTQQGWIGEDEVEEGEDSFTYWISPGIEGEGDEGKEEEARGKSIRLMPGEYFDLQFGRRVLADVVGAGREGWNWRDCVLSPEEEKKDAERFKEAFREFDFTMEE